jgi:hypothetical protein
MIDIVACLLAMRMPPPVCGAMIASLNTNQNHESHSWVKFPAKTGIREFFG